MTEDQEKKIDVIYWQMRNIKIKYLSGSADTDQEYDHVAADNLLCDALKILGCEKLIKEYDEIPKWYA